MSEFKEKRQKGNRIQSDDTSKCDYREEEGMTGETSDVGRHHEARLVRDLSARVGSIFHILVSDLGVDSGDKESTVSQNGTLGLP